MILHVLSDSPYTYRFIDFVNKMFTPADHKFVVLISKNSRFANYYGSIENCQIAHSRFDYFKAAAKFYKAEKIIFHQLNQPRLLLILSILYPLSLRKSTWSIWGGDAYFHLYKEDTLKDKLIERIFAHSIRRFPTIAAYIPGDYAVVKKRYGINAKYIQAKYPSPIDVDYLREIKKLKKNQPTKTILVGNSGDPSNAHIATFELLYKYKDNDIKVVSVLSYGGSKDYVGKVIENGAKIFGDKFTPITEYMALKDYLWFASDVDICVFNHKLSQGLGNLYLFFSLGGKVFISNQTSPYKYYKSIGVELFATEDIQYMSFEAFCRFSDESRKNNMALILKEIDYTQLRLEWESVFFTA